MVVRFQAFYNAELLPHLRSNKSARWTCRSDLEPHEIVCLNARGLGTGDPPWLT